MRGLAAVGAAFGAASCANSCTSVSNSWLWRRAAEQHQRQHVAGPADRRCQRGPVHAGHMHVHDRQVIGLRRQHLQRLRRELGVLHHHAPLGGLQRQDAPVGGVVV
ncbi:MAG: hypothetical protein MUF16_17000, partial [Burkholderiaceae bacterium]|nr:hypothetical protein [Burkholderiaceae bacterium]